jgi:hypothetical protein
LEAIDSKIQRLSGEGGATVEDIGQLAASVQQTRAAIEARQAETGADDERARQSLIVLKRMQATLTDTLRQSVMLAAAAAPPAPHDDDAGPIALLLPVVVVVVVV